ncbi:hypothetical protein MJO28_014102 [Puccinia striiformis f. sp. tritici]|uniref:tRNA ligase kinase domain-containing protein n=3 Tax=Puccinia striiformis TaxID=27350 RepID=A0A2S4USV2_9BASI|nr:hypothetical protein Pst134EA_025414 [Puccinia striiformis f. sp. tritici]KAI9612959.1 hypothetical protein H4Q26_010228 [Puccinia striiformis f. sp. tritici PST-130]POW00308.1 hypothetical protein PSHT_13102 [Puccinia striiformis]KAH9443651.1 hypothetical protein Pst134EB_026050 [Puccinia striiformis f. sp. tritici]KAH9451460.1 hypothetical protein Pst134EA_025414 [Puccinia striiformis f. sp. tritici]KAI7940450.1 hypothetical protein MJO28_014102 [Puccinia striiformis f. sp. tritici]
MDIEQQPPRILVLAGWVGSGKSTFAIELEKSNPNYVRICQDVLKKRQACEALARRSLAEGKSIIIDRQNFDRKQRLTWIKLSQEFGTKDDNDKIIPLECDLIEFATPYEECLKRLEHRTGHESIHSIQEGTKILSLIYHKQWVSPHISEGFSRHLILYPSNDLKPDATKTNNIKSIQISFPVTYEIIRSILDTLDSIPVTTTIQTITPHPHQQQQQQQPKDTRNQSRSNTYSKCPW